MTIRVAAKKMRTIPSLYPSIIWVEQGDSPRAIGTMGVEGGAQFRHRIMGTRNINGRNRRTIDARTLQLR